MNDFREYSDYLMHYTPKSSKRRRGNVSSKPDFLTSIANEMERIGNKAQEAGDRIVEMINKGEYIGAYNYYKSLDDETKKVIKNYVMNHKLPEVIGNGNEREGKHTIDQARKLMNDFFAGFAPKYEVNQHFILNDDVKDFRTGRRRRR